MDERTNKKCELVLVAPLRTVDIVIGKTVPYLIATMAILAVVTVNIKGFPTNPDILKSILLTCKTRSPLS